MIIVLIAILIMRLELGGLQRPLSLASPTLQMGILRPSSKCQRQADFQPNAALSRQDGGLFRACLKFQMRGFGASLSCLTSGKCQLWSHLQGLWMLVVGVPYALHPTPLGGEVGKIWLRVLPQTLPSRVTLG